MGVPLVDGCRPEPRPRIHGAALLSRLILADFDFEIFDRGDCHGAHD